MAQDYYQTLGVDKNASESDIKSAYRKMAMKHHPDRNQDDPKAEQTFKQVTQAYEILKDPQKKAAYDQYGHSAFEQGGGGRGSHGQGSGFSGFNEIFEEMFGGQGDHGAGTKVARGDDLRYDISISLTDAFNGIEKIIEFKAYDVCGTCNSSGAAAGSKLKKCGACHGRGRVRMQQGFFMVESVCGHCNGMGETIETPCRDCTGQGRQRLNRKVKVKIPAGVEDGSRIRLGEQGEAATRSPHKGDLYVFINIIEHDFFARHGNDLVCEVPVSFATAALGAAVEVPTIDGKKASIKIPAGAQSGKKLRLRDKGMTVMRHSARGDMIVIVNVETPVNLDAQQRELLRQLENSMSKRNNPDSQGFFDKIRSLWS